MRSLKVALFLTLFVMAHRVATATPVILSPTAIVANTMGTFPCCGYNQVNMINQAGLLAAYTSGVTDFNTYLATNPLHTVDAFCCEWFSPDGVMSGSLTFDLGAIYQVDRVAAWADEFAGFGTTNVFSSLDNSAFTLVGTFTPTNHLSLAQGGPLTYGADVAALLVTNGRYIRFDISGPQVPRDYNGLGIGEVAFSVSTAVPEPTSLMLLGCGLFGIRRLRRRNVA